jgi:hypothetical protein
MNNKLWAETRRRPSKLRYTSNEPFNPLPFSSRPIPPSPNGHEEITAFGQTVRLYKNNLVGTISAIARVGFACIRYEYAGRDGIIAAIRADIARGKGWPKIRDGGSD